MKRARRRGLVIVVAAMTAGSAPACSGDEPHGPVECATGALLNGERVAPGDYEFAVRVGVGEIGCTGTIIGPRAIVIAAHCVEASATLATLRGGPTAETCVAGGQCEPVTIEVRVHPELDVAVIRLVDLEIAEPSGGFARLDDGGSFTRFDLLGYGEGGMSGDGGTCHAAFGRLLLHGTVDVGWEGDQSFGAFAAEGGPAVCDGDSGGPALVLREGTWYLVGVLTSSYSDPNGGHCTPVGGFEMWARVQAVAGWIRDQIQP